MSSIVYLVGAVVIIGVVLKMLGVYHRARARAGVECLGDHSGSKGAHT